MVQIQCILFSQLCVERPIMRVRDCAYIIMYVSSYVCMYVRMYVEEEVSLSKCLLKIVYFVCIVCMFCLCSRSYRH